MSNTFPPKNRSPNKQLNEITVKLLQSKPLVRNDKHYFEQVWAYEIPHIPACKDSKTQSCCFVDMNSEKLKKTPVLELLSVRRCVRDLRFLKYLPSVVGVVSEKTGIRQLVHNIPFSMVSD